MHSLTIITDLRHFAQTVLLVVGALLPIVDPLGAAPIYLAMTAGLMPEQREVMAKAVAVNSFLLLIASALVGAYVLDLFGLSIPAVQVGSGILVRAIAWSLLNDPGSPAVFARNATPRIPRAELEQRAFYPLTMPLTVGPGSISVALTLGANSERGIHSLVVTTSAHAIGIVITSMAVYLCYRYAHRILNGLGPTVTGVAIRLSAFILLCIGVQICWNGLHALLAMAFTGVLG
jgi:multiple antibiotic resistance protein